MWDYKFSFFDLSLLDLSIKIMIGSKNEFGAIQHFKMPSLNLASLLFRDLSLENNHQYT